MRRRHGRARRRHAARRDAAGAPPEPLVVEQPADGRGHVAVDRPAVHDDLEPELRRVDVGADGSATVPCAAGNRERAVGPVFLC